MTFRYSVSIASNSSGTVAFLYMDSTDRCQIDSAAVANVTVAAPLGWIGEIRSNANAGWVASQDHEIRAGQTLEGFALSLKSVIGLCPFRLRPSVDTTALGIPNPGLEGDLAAYYAKVNAAVTALSVIGTTIGPVQPAPAFDANQFLASLIADKEQAIQLGWIKNQGIGNSLDAKLNAASASLQRGDNKTAVNHLNALLNEVNAQAGKQLSPEAVALLKFNTQYLISKIQ